LRKPFHVLQLTPIYSLTLRTPSVLSSSPPNVPLAKENTVGKRKAVEGAAVTPTKNLTEHDGHMLKQLEGVEVKAITPLGRDICVVAKSEWQGKLGLDIRRYYLSADEEIWCPTGKGIRIPEDSVNEFLQAVKQIDFQS
jgi:hypothetical protein